MPQTDGRSCASYAARSAAVMGPCSLMRARTRSRVRASRVASSGTEGAFEGESGWHSGAGVGVRYLTPIGPIRLDVAGPTGGETGEGLQVYLGLGQAF